MRVAVCDFKIRSFQPGNVFQGNWLPVLKCPLQGKTTATNKIGNPFALKTVMVVEVSNPGIVYESDSGQGKSAFPCFCCGICCTGYQVHLEMTEAQEIADNLHISLQKFLGGYTDPRWPGTDTRLLRHNAGACVFLEQENGSAIGLCRIHAFKPIACRQWSASLYRKECRQGLSRYWGLSVDDSGEIVGPSEELQCFQTFLKTLK